MYDDTLYVVE
jgi:hypothetical protein